MRWWPSGPRLRGATPPVQASPASVLPGVPNRPSTVIGFLSDLSSNPKQAVTFVFIVSAIVIIPSACFVGVCLAVAAAAKDVRGIQLRYMWPFGVGGAGAVTLVTTVTIGWVRKLAKAARGGAKGDGQNGGS
jgi:hypothetical protein